MNFNVPFFVFALFASLSVNVFAHYDPFLPGQHTHRLDADSQAMLIAVGILFSVYVLKKTGQKILAVVTKKK